MLTQDQIERERYEARRKAQLDYNSEINAARRKGEQRGLRKGRKEGHDAGLKEGQIDKIQFCENLLKRPETPRKQLERLTLEKLTRLAEDLQAEVLARR